MLASSWSALQNFRYFFSLTNFFSSAIPFLSFQPARFSVLLHNHGAQLLNAASFGWHAPSLPTVSEHSSIVRRRTTTRLDQFLLLRCSGLLSRAVPEAA